MQLFTIIPKEFTWLLNASVHFCPTKQSQLSAQQNTNFNRFFSASSWIPEASTQSIPEAFTIRICARTRYVWGFTHFPFYASIYPPEATSIKRAERMGIGNGVQLVRLLCQMYFIFNYILKCWRKTKWQVF